MKKTAVRPCERRTELCGASYVIVVVVAVFSILSFSLVGFHLFLGHFHRWQAMSRDTIHIKLVRGFRQAWEDAAFQRVLYMEN